MAKTAARKKPIPKRKTTRRPVAAAPPAALAPAAAPVPAAAPIAAPPAAAPVMVWATPPEAPLTPPKSTVTNVIDDPSVSLQRFDLLDLQPYTQEKVYATTASKDFHLFYVGRDDVHDILKHVLSRVSVSLYLNMFGFDDGELNDILMKIALDATITMLVTLDKSQAGGKHEKALLDADRKLDLALFNTHVAIGQSLTHQISHTKGFVADGKDLLATLDLRDGHDRRLVEDDAAAFHVNERVRRAEIDRHIGGEHTQQISKHVRY